MGMYDTYGVIQIKAGDCTMDSYFEGDHTNLNDGVYVAPEGVVVVRNGRVLLAAVDFPIYSKWGDRMNAPGNSNFLYNYDYIADAVAESIEHAQNPE